MIQAVLAIHYNKLDINPYWSISKSLLSISMIRAILGDLFSVSYLKQDAWEQHVQR